MPRYHTISKLDPENPGKFIVEDIPFTAAEETARNVEEAVWEVESPARAMTRLRTERNALLASSDWTQSPDSPLGDEAKTEWSTYRQSLRDLPANTPDPADPTWPTLLE